MNPLLEDFNTPYNTAPFSTIQNEHFKPAFQKAISIGKKEIAEITNNSDTPSFKNTTIALEKSGELLVLLLNSS